jgi:hypothetical protein
VRDLEATLTIHNFRAPFSRVFYKLALTTAALELTATTRVEIDFPNLPYRLDAGGRVFAELEIPFGSGPGGMAESNLETLVFDLGIEPPAHRDSGLTTGGKASVGIGVIMGLLCAAGGIYYLRVGRHAKQKEE